ncbi:MAG: response regulator [Anaerolineae bacterium]|jgi:two-component system cell cycle response regulator DivK|nr:response regulator [Anaerolineae bacterium]
MARILYIEDNPLNMRLVRKMLLSDGYTVLEAVDGAGGLAAAEREQPALILVDINLPDVDGLEVVRRLKNNPVTASIPAIALTANVMHGDKTRCLEAGCDGYLAKPVARLEMLNIIRYFLTRDHSTPAVVR